MMSRLRFCLLTVFVLACNGEPKETGELPPIDADGDGFAEDVDCNDSDDSIHPDADEICDGLDNNCDDSIDPEDSVDASVWYADADGDGYGDEGSTMAACEVPAGFSADSTDCDDGNDAINPDATEVCDSIDNDCDDSIDEDLPTATYYADADGDSYGDPDVSIEFCEQPDEHVDDNQDCDDTDATVHPDATDGLLADRDCVDGIADDDLSLSDFSFVGVDEFDTLGFAIATAGDVDGDGLDDILVGTNYNDDAGFNAGKAYLILGSSLGSNPQIDLLLADYSFAGENIMDEAGYAVSSAGDVDGDGLDDILVGADRGGDVRGGKAYLILGSSLDPSSPEMSLSLADHSFVGENSGDHAGASVSSAGDVDGDGLSDILVGASGNDDGGNVSGKAYLILGSSLGGTPEIDLSDADQSFVGEDTGDNAGYNVSSAGDVDGDGLDDILVGAPGAADDGGDDTGKSYLILGSSLDSSSPEMSLSLADYNFVGEAHNDNSGITVSGAGDVDGDGLDDILVAATWGGKAYLILGGSLGATAEIDLSLADYSFVGLGYLFGGAGRSLSVSSAGDVDGDGLDDILIGSPVGAGGEAYLFLGASLGTTAEIDLSLADYSFVAENSGDCAGASVSSAGDVDGDGRDDLLVAAPYNHDGGYEAGKGYLILSGL